MSDGSLPKWVRHVGSWGQARPGVAGTCFGAVLGLSTVVLSATNTISAQQAIAMAVPAIVTMIGGLVRMLVLDSWTAWRRGFEQGCRMAVVYRLHSPSADDVDAPVANGAADPGRPGSRLAGHRWPPEATN
jgi:hypothetical protein